MIATALSPGAVRRAAEAGAGVVYDGATPVERLRKLSTAYDQAGGAGPIVLIRRVWLGEPPTEAFDRQAAVYRSYASTSADHSFLTSTYADQLATALRSALREAGATCLNLRVHVPGVTPAMAREQIERLGTEVLPGIRT